MTYEDLTKFVQRHFTDGLVLVVGSGLSCAEGIPGMPGLAEHLCGRAVELTGEDADQWAKVKLQLEQGKGLEAALINKPPTETLERWIARETASLLIPVERDIICAVLRGDRELRLTMFLKHILRPPAGLPILTPNYDRLIEVACEMAGFHVDTMAVGHYAGVFDPKRSSMASAKGLVGNPRKTPRIEHFPWTIVLKPHGSFDWYKVGNDVRRCSLDTDGDRLIITPGLNKYQAGYSAPFDQHREYANHHIRRATHLLIVGYGFNDDHLQTHLLERIKSGIPTLILNRSCGDRVRDLFADAPYCITISRHSSASGFVITVNGQDVEHGGKDLWDLGVLTESMLI